MFIGKDLTRLTINQLRLNPFKEDTINMKRKFFSVLFAVVLVLSMSIVMAPVAAASSVSSVWMQFETAAHSDVATNAQYTIHFTTSTALSRGVDTITVIFPDGLDSDMGPITTQDSYDFELGSAVTTASLYSVDPTGDPLLAGTTYVACTAVATIAGYRVQVTTPVDIPASTAATLKIATGATITTPAVAASTYKIKVATSQDTTFVLSDAFSVDDTVLSALTSTTNYPSSLVAGSAAAYKFSFTCANDVAIGGTVTVEFPVGTTMPSTISTANVYVGDGTEDPTASAVSVSTASRTVTVTTAEVLSGASVLYIKSEAVIKNKTTLGHLDVHMWTSADGQKFGQEDTDTIVSGTATKLAFCNDSTNGRSDAATILYAFTGALIIRSVDTYGNLKHITGTEPTVALSVTTGAGAFYTAQNTSNPYTNTEMAGGILSSDTIYYRPTSTGTHTLQAATVGSPSLTLATWTVTVAPAVVLKDANDITIGTYGPTSTSTTDATYGGAWIQAAIDAAFPGDTVELGGTAAAPAIYEVDAYINLNKKVTLTSATSASYTTLRPVGEGMTTQFQNATDIAILVAVTGTSANPVIIDGLTFTRLRSGVEFDQAIYNPGYNYVTVQNCVFNYIKPEQVADHEWGAVVGFVTYHEGAGSSQAAITSATISDNTFTNCGTFGFTAWGEQAAVINVFVKNGATDYAIGGVTVSGNTLTSNNGIGIAMKGLGNADTSSLKGNVTDNTLTDSVYPISIQGYTDGINVLRNTITGGYMAGLWVEFTKHESLVIKNNTITGVAGTGASSMDYSAAILLMDDGGDGDEVTVQFNDIYNNDATYSIYAVSTIEGGAQTCQYNYYGDSTGPYYSALAGATVSTSNTAGTGDKVSDKVTYYPWLYKSRADVVTDNANYCAQRISLAVGIHTLSTPALLITTADTIAELMPDYATNMEYCYKFDDGIWSNIGTDTLTPCHGYYIKMTVADSVLLQYAADQYDTPSWLLDEGWNLISLANLSSKIVESSVTSVLKDSAGLPGYSQVVSPSMNTSPWSYSAGETAATTYMLVGEGYWIYMQNDATLAGFTIFPLVPDLD